MTPNVAEFGEIDQMFHVCNLVSACNQFDKKKKKKEKHCVYTWLYFVLCH